MSEQTVMWWWRQHYPVHVRLATGRARDVQGSDTLKHRLLIPAVDPKKLAGRRQSGRGLNWE